jgi:2-isopropylmalate synthase
VDDAIRIYDTTLRDGCQAARISLSLQDKLDIARRLDAFGVDWVEGGWPGSNPKDAHFFDALREEPLEHARAAAFGSTRRAGIHAEEDSNLALLIDAETPTVALVAKAWSFHVDAVLRTTPDENLRMVADSVRFLKERGREVVLDAEHFFDGYRADRDHALGVLRAAADAGADWLVLCDTNGGSLPEQVASAVAEVVREFDTPVGIHAHNDGELAVANSLAAVAAGARQVQGTINGYGERVGNANLTSLIPDLVLKLGLPCRAGERLSELTDLAHFVDDVAGVAPNPRLPFVGYAAFAHKGGIHVHAVAADPATYEHVDPSLVGNTRRVLVSELSGRMNIVERARELGLQLEDGAIARELARKVKELESDGFQFEDAEASFELLVRRAGEEFRRPFEPRAYAVDSRKGLGDDGSSSLAEAEIGVGGEILRGVAHGKGPVDALERAFRRALVPAYPHLSRVSLSDFRAEIVHGSDVAGPVRVRITGSAPGREPWTTVGSSTDLLHAAWLALTDCLEFAVLSRAGVEDGVPTPQPETRGVSLPELAESLRPELDDDDRRVLARVMRTDWSSTSLDIADQDDRAAAARATALGAALFYAFGNFYAVAGHPHRDSVVRINLLKGRPENQVGSVTTTRDRFSVLFDWDLVPKELTQEQVLAVMDDFFTLGPMGFRGPAAHGVPGQLTSLDAGIRTTQVIAPGYRCPSNELIEDVLRRIGEEFLFITSANVSGGVTGKVEAAHYDLEGIQRDFGTRDGIVLIGHREEGLVRAGYARHLPMSTSILAFHRLEHDERGRPALVLERHGSLPVDEVRGIVANHGFGLVLGDGARERLPMRDDLPVGA